MSKKIREELRQKAIEMVKAGDSKSQVAKELGLGRTTVARIAKDVGKTFSYFPDDIKQDVLFRIENGQSAASVARELNIYKSLISIWQKNAKKTRRIFTKCSEETKQEAIRLVESGLMYVEIGKRFGVSPSSVRYWFQKAQAQGLAVMPIYPIKRSDIELTWVQRQYPHLNQWREFAVEWLKGEHNGLGSKTAALVTFFTKYLNDQKLPSAPEDLLRRGTIAPDFFRTACPQSSGGITYNNRIFDFINWVLLHYFSERADDGSPIVSPAFRNPLVRLTSNGFPVHYESVQTPLPYGYITDLRRILGQGRDFRDWLWAQNALGVKRVGEVSTRMALDWFPVSESQIDKSDPDCVWRFRESIDPKIMPVLEMWSPVRWVALLIKLQLPPRTFQVRILDSGESDTWRYVAGQWVSNTNPLSMGNKRHPIQRGVLRRIEKIGNEDVQTVLYFNTNKTADILKCGTEKGYVFPWPVVGDIPDQPHYWLEKMRNWQEKYNPIKRPTPWRDIPPRCLGEPKSEMQLASYPDTCFLFRTAERKKFNESHLPVSDGTLSGAWGKLLEEMQIRLCRNGTTHPDGSPIILTTRTGNSPVAVFPLHSLRVSLITALAVDGGLPFHLLVKLAGHSRLMMTLYYTKPGFKHMQDALNDAAERIDALKEKSIIAFLANAEHAKLMDLAIWNSQETIATLIPEQSVNRNPAGWMPMHHGLCLVGGNTSEIDASTLSNKGGSKIGGCHNGGPAINPDAENRQYRQVPGGVRNCIRCRWFVTEPHYVPALAAHLGNICYQFDETRSHAIKQDELLQNLKRKKAKSEDAKTVFTQMQDLRTTERLWEATMQRFSSLAEDMAACWQLIQRCNALTTTQGNPQSTILIAVGSAMDVHAGFEEVDSELLQLSGICQNVEIYPDLNAGKAVFRRSQLLDAALARDHLPPIFLQLSEEEQLRAGNAFMQALAQKANQNPLLGIRHICNLVDAGKSLAEFMGADINDLLQNTIQSSEPLRLYY